MKTFKDLEFKKHPSVLDEDSVAKLIKAGVNKDSEFLSQDMTNAKIELNGKQFSVIFGKMFYSNGVDTYEAWDMERDDEPRGFLSEDEVTEYMLEVQNDIQK